MRAPMKPGLRLQILLLLGGLLLLAFVPLYVAVGTYISYALQEIRDESARSLGRAVAGHVAEARARRTPEQLRGLLDAEVGSRGVEAIGVYAKTGEVRVRVGQPVAVDSLPLKVDPLREDVIAVSTKHGRALAVIVPGNDGPVVAVLRTDDEVARAAPLVRLVGLYMGVVGLAFLVVAYFALTRLIVRPLDALSASAQRVASGARKWDVPTSGPREMAELSVSLQRMTAHLLSEEESLRRKVDEVEARTKELREAQDRLVRTERLASVGRLAAGLAHEIGNPIAALIGMQDLLLAGGLTEEEQQDFLKRMQKESERINRILRDLLEFARPVANQEQEGAGDVESAIYDTVTLVTPQSSMRDVELIVDVYSDLPKVALGSERLVQVILNLLLNAADVCGAGGRVRLSAHRSDDGPVVIHVEDSGPGVDAELADKLFEPFFTTKEVGKGTGLGLAVCRGLVESVGGTIEVDQHYEDGARFVVTLPVTTDLG